MNVNYGIGSKFKVDDSDLARVERRFRAMADLGTKAAVSMGTAFTRALRAPGVIAAFNDMEKRLRRLDMLASRIGTGMQVAGRPQASFRDRIDAMFARHDAASRRAARGTEAARLRMINGRIEDDIDAMRPTRAPTAPRPRGFGGGMLGAGAVGGMGMVFAEAAGQALYMGAVGGIQAFTTALTTAARTIHDLNLQAESSIAGLQANFMALDKASAGNARMAARGTYRRLERMAAVGPGETQDYIDAFQRIYAPARSRGASVGDVEKLAGLAIASGAARGGPGAARYAAMDVYQALTSGVNLQHTPFAVQALNNAGISMDQFRAADGAEQLRMLMKGFETYTPAIVEFSKTVAAQEDTFSDSMKRLIRTVSSDVFEVYRINLMRVNASLDDLNAQVGQGGLVDTVRVVNASLGKMTDDFARGFMLGIDRGGDNFEEAVRRLAWNLGLLSEETETLTGVFGAAVGRITARFGTLLVNSANATANIISGSRAVSGVTGGSEPADSWFPAGGPFGFIGNNVLGRVVGGISNAWNGPSPQLIPPTEAENELVTSLAKGTEKGVEAGLSKGRRSVEIKANVVWGDTRSLALPLREAVHHGMALAGLAPIGSPESSLFQGG